MLSANHVYHQPAMPLLLIDFDLNGTIILQDSSKGAGWQQMLISALAKNTFYDWDGKHGALSYKDYVDNVLMPGDKSDQPLKKKRLKVIDKFLHFLVASKHPLKNDVLADYVQIKTKFTDAVTGKIQPKVFPSFYKLLEKLKALNIPYVMKLRTFGDDRKHVAEEIERHPSGIKFARWGKFAGQKLQLEGEGEFAGADNIFNLFVTSKAHFAIQDDWPSWNKSGELGTSGKPFIFDSQGHKIVVCDALGKKREMRVLELAWDDNATGQKKDIFNTLDISAKQASTNDLLHKQIFPVNTEQAMKDDNYFINDLRKALLNNGFGDINSMQGVANPPTEEQTPRQPDRSFQTTDH